jgi:hypothetical protein
MILNVKEQSDFVDDGKKLEDYKNIFFLFFQEKTEDINRCGLWLKPQPLAGLIILSPPTKECNYGIRGGQISSNLTKFIVSSISIYVFK